MRNAEHPDVRDLNLTSVLAAMADPVRMHLVQSLADGRELAWGDLDVPVPIGKSTLSHHLKTLRSAGVTRTRQEGTRCFVRLRIDDLERRFPGVLRSIIDAADPVPGHSRRPHGELDDDEQAPCDVVDAAEPAARVAGAARR